MNFAQFLEESIKEDKGADDSYTHIVTITDADEDADDLAKKLKAGKETQVINHLKDWDNGESNEVVTKKAFGRDSTVYEKGEYVLVYNLKLDNSISLYRKGE